MDKDIKEIVSALYRLVFWVMILVILSFPGCLESCNNIETHQCEVNNDR
jgi:hypothetical protein